MGGGKNFMVTAAGLSILGNGIFWWKAKTKRLFSQCRRLDSVLHKDAQNFKLLSNIQDQK
jgi:hypothetical protein